MKKALIFIICLVLLIGTVLAEDVTKVGDWWGKVTINGVENDKSAVVDAYINNIKVASAIVGQYASGYYLIHVEGEIGDMILFKVNGHDATTQSWSNEDHRLDLVVTYTSTSNGDSPSGGGGGGSIDDTGTILGFLETETNNLTNLSNNETNEEPISLNGDKGPKESTNGAPLTGAVTGFTDFAKSGAGALTLSVLVLTGLAIVTVLLKKRFAKKLSGETETETESK